jgi:hypothetical protein
MPKQTARFCLRWGKLHLDAVGTPASIIATAFALALLTRWLGWSPRDLARLLKFMIEMVS